MNLSFTRKLQLRLRLYERVCCTEAACTSGKSYKAQASCINREMGNEMWQDTSSIASAETMQQLHQ
jgi:hypothetical protein